MFVALGFEFIECIPNLNGGYLKAIVSILIVLIHWLYLKSSVSSSASWMAPEIALLSRLGGSSPKTILHGMEKCLIATLFINEWFLMNACKGERKKIWFVTYIHQRKVKYLIYLWPNSVFNAGILRPSQSNTSVVYYW